MSVKFGIVEYKGLVAGLTIQSINFDETCSEAEAMDEEGNITQIDQYGFKRTISGEGNILTVNADALVVGSTLTIDEVDYKINNVSKAKSNAAHQRCTFSGSAPMKKPTTPTEE